MLTSRIIFFLLKTHHHQIVANRVMRTALIPLRRSLREGLRRQKETLGYNLAALRFVQRQNDARRTAEVKEERYDLFSSLLDANEEEADSEAKLSDSKVIGE